MKLIDTEAKAAAASQGAPLAGLAAAGLASRSAGYRFTRKPEADALPIVSDLPGGLIVTTV